MIVAKDNVNGQKYCSLKACRVCPLCDTSPLWHFVDTFAISSMMRGKDGVLVLGIHLVLLGQGKSVGQCCTLNTTGFDGVNDSVHLLQTVSDVGLTRSR